MILYTTASAQTYTALPELGQQGSFTIRHISTSEGLSSNIITAIVKDNAGYMWFSTPNGICRWDGFRAIIYKHDDTDSLSLINDQIGRNAFIYDSLNSHLIIGTNKGLSVFDPERGIFFNYYINPKKKNALQSPINSVYLDRQNILWVGTDQGFCRFCPEKNDFIYYSFTHTLPDGLILDRNLTNHILDIKQDYTQDSILWLATLAGLLKFNKQTEKINWYYFSDKDYLREINQFTMLVPHPDGKLYIGTWNFDMAVFDTQTETFTQRFGPASHGKDKVSNRVIPYRAKSETELWISSLQGLGILNTSTNTIDFIRSFKNDKGHRFAPELFCADGDHFWMGSEYGVFVLNFSKSQFSNYFFDPVDEDHWYLTNCIYEDKQSGELLIGYGRGEGLHTFNPTIGQFNHIPFARRSIMQYNVVSILPINTDEFLVLSFDEIYSYNRDERKLTPLNCSYQNFPAFTDMNIDAKGTLWLSSGNSGLQKLREADNSLETIRDWNTFFETGHELPLFSELCIDEENRIWFRRRGESYGYYNMEKDSVCYFSDPGKSFDITSFSEIENDTIWVATAHNGLGFIDTRNPEYGVHLAFTYDNLKVETIEEIAIDKKDRVWCLTEKGLMRINRKNGKADLFDESYGISVHDPWSNKSSIIPGELKILSDGRMVIGYRRGLGFFHPDSLKVIHQTPEPYLISIRVSDKNIQWDKDQLIKLNHDENYITFSYSALDLYNAGITFRHRLEGVEKDWKEPSSLEDASYSNLPPGNYTFIVQTISRSGFGEKKELKLNFRILPPWWKTSWAYALFLILALSILYIFYRFQLRRQLALRETQRLRELDELKTRLYANITHEFRTPITVIMGMAEELTDKLDKKDKPHFLKKLETIERNSSNLLHLVNQMLDLAKLENGKLNYAPVQANIIPWLQYMVESHQSLAAAKEIQLTFYTEVENLMMDYDADQLSKVISNLLTNAIKFTDKRGKVICHVKHDLFTNKLHLKIKDDGIGIPEAEQSRIFDRFYQVDASERRNRSGTGIGLSLTREIVEMIGGTIRVKSQPGKGSEFEVAIPVTQNAPLKSTGLEPFEKPFIKREMPDQEEIEDINDAENDKEKPLVLIAEDNHDVAGYIRDTIRTQYRVKWASDGEKGLQMAFDLIPDLVITDVMMPGKDGFEVCNTLKTDERTDHIPVIMLTAKVTDTDRIEGYERGADAYLTKPFNKKELLVRLQQLLHLRKQLQAKFSKMDFRVTSLKPQTPEEQFIRKAAQIVEANLEKSMFNATDLASEVHLSESQLYRKLKAISGKSTAIFIRTVRLKKAMELLKTSNLSISEIAYQVGFNDPAWFSRVFKEEFVMSPTEARLKG